MDVLFKLWFDGGIINYLLIMLTIMVLWLMFIAGVRVVLEHSIRSVAIDIVKFYFTYKAAAHSVGKKVESGEIVIPTEKNEPK